MEVWFLITYNKSFQMDLLIRFKVLVVLIHHFCKLWNIMPCCIKVGQCLNHKNAVTCVSHIY